MFLEATLIGILCYLGALSSLWLLGLTGGWYTITRPLVSGMLVGPSSVISRPDPHRGGGAGGLYRHGDAGWFHAGGSQLRRLSGHCAGHTVGQGAVGGGGHCCHHRHRRYHPLQLHDGAQLLLEPQGRRGTGAGGRAGVYLNSAIFPQASNFVLRFVPTFIAVYFGNQYIEGFMNSLPELVIRTMTVVGASCRRSASPSCSSRSSSRAAC